ncbi:LemA family protein [Azohydromonas lata]|uniref:LemA family protein n=1 Tax=Azohydromonas lata TaxID=45677 RepID=A0ABU5IB70_9BURK|nr:LemA family protein [Azohydromonas lata]MDZ5456347.1 LemA family protein [Azohydromonas lata]
MSWETVAEFVAAVLSHYWLGLMAAVAVLWMLGAHNRLMRHRAAIVAAWGQLDEQMKRRREVLPPLVDALREPLAAEAPALDAVLEAQAQLQRAVDALKPLAAKSLAEVLHAESRLTSAQTRLKALLEQHPELVQREDIAGWMQALKDVQTRKDVARHVFNDAVNAYNQALLQYPTRLLKPLFGLRTAVTL